MLLHGREKEIAEGVVIQVIAKRRHGAAATWRVLGMTSPIRLSHDRTGTFNSNGSGGHGLGVVCMEKTTTVDAPRKELSPKSANNQIDRSSP